MKAKFTHWYNALATTLLSLLGFSSCGGNDDPANVELLYGTPTSSFQVKGNVTSEDGTPIEGIKATLNFKYSGWTEKEAVYTDSKGDYIMEKNSMTGTPISKEEDIIKVIFEDVDGEANGGTFANDTVMGKDLTIKKVGEGSGAWNQGSFEITANAKLKKKQ